MQFCLECAADCLKHGNSRLAVALLQRALGLANQEEPRAVALIFRALNYARRAAC